MAENVHHDNQGHFKLHIERGSIQIPQKAEEINREPEKKPESPNQNNHSKNNKFVEILRDGADQIIASAVILALLFLAINFQAYYQIAKNEIDKLLGNNNNEVLNEIAEGINQDKVTTVLQTTNGTSIQKQQIPELNLEIAPSDTRIIIPRINKNVPVIRTSSASLVAHDWEALENEIQDSLRSGVVHYPGTSLPGQGGNVVITGHSSYFPWDPGRFKDVFALLHDLVINDKIVLYYDQEKYVYEVTEKLVVLPDEIDILKGGDEEELTLITCTPVGTNLKRLVIKAKPVKS